MDSSALRLGLYSASVGLFFGIVGEQLGLGSGGSGSGSEEEDLKVLERDLVVYEHVNVAFEEVRDVVVAGSGAAGCMAALGARWAAPRSDVLMVEKLSEVGGETRKSGGIVWIPNNPLMRKAGLVDDRADAVKHLCRWAYPEEYREELGEEMRFGLTECHFDKLVHYYETGYKMLEQLQARGHAPNLSHFQSSNGEIMTDYSYSPDVEPENKAPRGRSLGIGQGPTARTILKVALFLLRIGEPLLNFVGDNISLPVKDLRILNSFGIDLSYGIGSVLVDSLKAALIKEGVTIQTRTAIDGLYKDIETGAINGVRVCTFDPTTKTIKRRNIGVRRGVIFGTGGFSANQPLVEKYISRSGRAVFQTGATCGSTGDFLLLAQKLGASTENLDKVWGCESYLESKEGWIQSNCLFQMRGDSFFVVNADGKRVYNEKMTYHKRAQVHWEKPQLNKFLFLIGDHRCASKFGTDFQKSWPLDLNNPIYITGNGLAELCRNIRARVRKIRLDGVLVSEFEWENWHMTTSFETNLANTVEKFNSFARNGVDEEFQRGETASELEWMGSADNGMINKTMYPLDIMGSNGDGKGKLYAIILCASLIDTKGGPAVDVHGRVLDLKGDPIPGIYGAGNAAAPISGDAYYSGGGTLGSAMVSGYTAGTHCVQHSRSVSKL